MARLDDDMRFAVPLYTIAEAARLVDVPATTFGSWAKGYRRNHTVGAPILTTVERDRAVMRAPDVPFIGLAEGLVLAGLRRAGVPLQRIRPALERLRTEMGLEAALANRRLYTDGAEILYDLTEDVAGLEAAKTLVVVRNGQRVFHEIVREYLQRIRYDVDSGYAAVIRLPRYVTADVVVDPQRSFGRPIFSGGGARVADVLERFWAGETLDELVEEFGVPAEELEDAVRVASRPAA